MRTYVLVEGHGEAEAVLNLLTRLAHEKAPRLLPFASPIRAVGMARTESFERYVEFVRAKRDAHAVLALPRAGPADRKARVSRRRSHAGAPMRRGSTRREGRVVLGGAGGEARKKCALAPCARRRTARAHAGRGWPGTEPVAGGRERGCKAGAETSARAGKFAPARERAAPIAQTDAGRLANSLGTQ